MFIVSVAGRFWLRPVMGLLNTVLRIAVSVLSCVICTVGLGVVLQLVVNLFRKFNGNAREHGGIPLQLTQHLPQHVAYSHGVTTSRFGINFLKQAKSGLTYELRPWRTSPIWIWRDFACQNFHNNSSKRTWCISSQYFGTEVLIFGNLAWLSIALSFSVR